MEYLGGLAFIDEVAGRFQILDVACHHFHAIWSLDLLRVGGTSQFIQNVNSAFRVVAMPPMDEVVADEIGATGDGNSFRHGDLPRSNLAASGGLTINEKGQVRRHRWGYETSAYRVAGH